MLTSQVTGELICRDGGTFFFCWQWIGWNCLNAVAPGAHVRTGSGERPKAELAEALAASERTTAQSSVVGTHRRV